MTVIYFVLPPRSSIIFFPLRERDNFSPAYRWKAWKSNKNHSVNPLYAKAPRMHSCLTSLLVAREIMWEMVSSRANSQIPNQRASNFAWLSHERFTRGNEACAHPIVTTSLSPPIFSSHRALFRALILPCQSRELGPPLERRQNEIESPVRRIGIQRLV